MGQDLRFRIAGRTGNNFALTRLMRNLEESAFIRNVTLIGAQQVTEGDRVLSEFSLEASYETPPPEPRMSMPPEVADAARDRDNVFGKYVLVEMIGRGSNGIVFKAWQSDVGRFVAVKILQATDLEQISRFIREAHLAATLNSPHIVRIHEAGRTNGRHFIAMDLVDGVTLDRAAVDLPNALRIIRDAARALHHAHRLGVVHRDVKPQNLMIDRGGRIVLMDFGLARPLVPGGTLSMTGTILGSPQYMSPEQACGEVRVDRRADIWGLGATLYFLVTRTPPYDGSNAIDVIRKVLEDEPRPPRSAAPSLPRAVETVILKAMQRERDRRYPSALEMADDLQRLLNGMRVTARRTSIWYRTKRRLLRRPLVSALAAALALCGVGAAATLTVQSILASRARAGIEAGQSAGRAYANRNFAEAAARADEAIERSPDYAIGHFWKGRVLLSEYTRRRTLPAAYTVEGTVAFSLPPPESTEQTQLKRRALEVFAGMSAAGRDGLEGWEEPCRAGIVRLFDGDYAGAESALTEAWASAKADSEVAFYLAQAQYFQLKFQAAVDTLENMRRDRGWSPEMEVAWAQTVHARLLERALRGEDPTAELRDAAGLCRRNIEDLPLARLAYAAIRLDMIRWDIDHGRDAGGALDGLIDEMTADDVAAHQVLGDAHAVRAAWLAARGDGAEAQIQYDEALRRFERAAILDPTFDGAPMRAAQTHVELAQLLASRGQRAAALAHLETAEGLLRRVRGEYAEVAVERAQVAGRLDRSRDGGWDAEIAALEAISHPRASLALGRAHANRAFDAMQRGEDPTADFEAAVGAFDAALAVNADWVDARLGRAVALLNHALQAADSAPLYEEMEADFEAALRANPKSALAFQSRGLAGMNRVAAMIEAGEDPTSPAAGAERDFREALAINPEMASAWRGLAGVRMNLAAREAMARRDATARTAAAEAALARALEINPEYAEALFDLGNLCANGGRLREAGGHYGASLRVRPDAADAHLMRGGAHLRLGEHEKALADYRRAAELNPALERTTAEAIRRCEKAIADF